MSVDLNDEIVQDFLVEGGEILDQLGNQLVELEQRGNDRDLLNQVFRGFHTIKGGAGFIGLDALVEVSHKAEDIFDLLRKGSRQVDASLMDVILQVHDVLNQMFETVRAGDEPQRAPDPLMEALTALARNQPLPSAAPTPAPAPVLAPEPAPLPDPEPVAVIDEVIVAEVPAPTSALETEPELDLTLPAAAEPVVNPAPDPHAVDITEAEFDALLDELDAQKKAGTAAVAEVAPAVNPPTDENITEEEFEALLDQLQAKKTEPPPAAVVSEPINTPVSEPLSHSAPASDDITEAEFDALLDKLQAEKKTATKLDEVVAAAPAFELPPATVAQIASVGSAVVEHEPPSASGLQSAPAVTPPSAPAFDETAADQAPAARNIAADSSSAKPAPKAASAAAPQAESTVRVETSVLDRIMNMVGELVLIRNRISTLEAAIGDEEFTKTASILDVVTSDLQAAVMKTRMQPVKKVFGRFPRVVRDLARALKKEVNLELHGEETDLDKNLVEALADPLVHLVRNSVDHGIEMPDVRIAAGKPAAGTVRLSAAQEGDHILLTIEDDGAGMDPDILRRKAVEKGLMDEDQAARLDEPSCYELIFAAGFSTKSEISDISGRGVGMDVVKTRINQLNGTIQIKSSLGKGTSIIVKLPLTLAIVPTLMVVLGSQIFALPLVNVNEIISFDEARTNVVDGREVMVVRGRAMPLFHLSNWLISGMRSTDGTKGHVVIVSIGTARFGLVVDQLIGQEEVVIKPLGAMLQGTKGLAGATITGDGRIALILDLPGLINSYAHIR